MMADVVGCLFILGGVVLAVVAVIITLLSHAGREIIRRLRRSYVCDRAGVLRPRPLRRALKRLYTVTERKNQCEYQANRDDTECPICLASFGRVSEDDTDTSRRRSEVDPEAGLGPQSTIASSLATPAPRNERRSFQPMDDEILRINRCGHAFHSRCLVTWFLREPHVKQHCPICRVQYYPACKPPEPAQKQEQVQVQEQGDTSTTRRDAGFPPVPIW
ncbi:hypothetical protein ANO14919_085720 [Xylariales sp. No.14919]|nr:hypothetical protein ANO14919_085720 [Xylariales sp. No.14919]